MKLLIYSHAFAPKIGGVETYVMLLAEGLTRDSRVAPNSDLQLTVVTPTPAGEMDDSQLPFRVVRKPSVLTLLTLLWCSDIIHLAGPAFVPLMLGLILRKPVVVEHHGYQAICPNGLLLHEPTKTVCPGHFMKRRYQKCLRCGASSEGRFGGLAKLLLTFPRRWACLRADANVAVSNHVKQRVGLAGTRVIYHGIPDPLSLSPQEAKHCKAASRSVTFAYVGRLVAEKGLDSLVQATERLKADHLPFIMKFIGDGPERPRLEAKVQTAYLCKSVEFTGNLRGIDLERVLNDVDVVVMPSIWEETAGLSAIEQMIRGRLVIAADIGGLGEIVAEAGIKFQAGNVDQLADCLRLVINQPHSMQRLGQKARIRAEMLFGRKRMLEEHLALFEQVVRKQNYH